MPAAQGTLLCVANYPANTGYAWDFLEGLYAAVADRVVASGITTFVAYPLIEVAPKTLAASVARPVTLDVSLRSLVSLWTVGAFIHRHRVRVVYFTDQPVFSTAYWWLRLMGVRHIIVYDHTSGARTPPRGVKYALKWLVCRLPGLAADRVIAVSDYVAERHRTVSLVPFGRVTRVWNGVQVPPDGAGTQAVRESLGVAADRPLVVCCGRAAPEKGVECLLRAFDRVITRLSPGGRRPARGYVGDGPHRAELEAVRATLASRGDVTFVGYRPDAQAYISAADLCVVPSVWQEALPLGVLQPMALGKPVIATRVGGVPEMLRDGIDGLLVPPGEVEPLADAIMTLLTDASRRAELGRQGRARVAEHFRPDAQIAALVEVVQEGFSNGGRFGRWRY